jgi:N-acetylglucosaminyldiphosphoundecaprenol N-acetyl-beta-D-mannosaminyltransferase
MTQAVDHVDRMIQSGRGGAVLAVNPEKVVRARNDPTLLAILHEAGLLIPDGIGVVAAARLAGLCRAERLPGADLMPALCALAERRRYPVFLYGARPQSNAGAVMYLRGRYPRLSIAGQQHGYLAEDEMPGLAERIRSSGTRILFVGLGSPRQERWLRCHLPMLPGVVGQGVGGTFDALSGIVPRAPMWAQRGNVEWLWQMVQQPERLRRLPIRLGFAMMVLRHRLVGHV